MTFVIGVQTVVLRILEVLRHFIHQRIKSAESIQVDEEIAATANQLSSGLAAYGHGLLFKPVYPHMIPSIDTSKYAGKICKIRERDTTWNAMTCVVKKEELKNDVV